MIKNCQICKAVINAGNGNTKYCEICRINRIRESQKAYHERKVRLKAKQEQEQFINESRCKLPKERAAKGQALQLCRDVHNAEVKGMTYGRYMAYKRRRESQ